MATIDSTKGSGASLPDAVARKVHVLTNVHDFSEVNATTADTVSMLDIPANTIVLYVISEVEVAGTATATYDLGDGADADGWDVAVAADAVAVTLGNGALNNANVLGKYYATADTISIDVKTANLVIGKIRVSAVCINANAN